MLSSAYGNRNEEIKELFHENGIEFEGRSPRDISFGKGKVYIVDQINSFAIYARGTETEKDYILKLFEDYNPVPGSVRRNPEASAPRKCCARWEHSTRDEDIMLQVVKSLLGR